MPVDSSTSLNLGTAFDDFSNSAATSGRVAVGSFVSGQLEAVNDRDWFAVDLIAGHTYAISEEGIANGIGTLPDPYLRLYDASNTQLAENDDAPTSVDSLVIYQAAASGTYYIAASSFLDIGLGSYVIRVNDTSVVVDDYAATGSTAGQISVGSSMTGELEVSGDRDWFRAQLVAGQRYTISLNGAASNNGSLDDPFLHIYNAAGNLIAQNDDFGGSHDSQIDFVPTASGTYFFEAAGFDQVGTYRLSLVTPGLLIFGNSGADNLAGGEGNDIIVSLDGNDTIGAGAGDDRANAGPGDDVIFGGPGDDELGGGAGSDTIVGDDGNDVIFGEDGNDVANGGAGNDTLLGGSGNDTFGGGVGDDVLVGQDGDDLLFGEDGNDNMNGGAQDDGVVGGTGNDTLGGGDGNDIILGQDGDDLMFGEAGNDAMNGGFGNDTVIGGDGADMLGGGAGEDLLQGGFGNDTLFGENGIDLLDGGAGNDVLIGGGNSDTFVFGHGDGADTIADFNVTEDRVWFASTNLHSFADVQAHMTFSAATGATTITYDGFFTVTLNAVAPAQLHASDFVFT